MKFDGSGGTVELNDTLNYSKDSVTVSAWFKQTGDASVQYQRIIGNDPTMWVDQTNMNVCVRLSATEAGASTQTCFETDIQQGRYHHIAFSYDSSDSKTRLYVDGGLVDTSNYYSGLMNGKSNDVQIGNGFSTNVRPWRGLIDNVRIYSCAFKSESS